MPFLVFLVTRLGGNGLIYGLLGATYSFFQLLGAPVLGRWSDRWGRRTVLLISQLGTLVSWCVFLVALLLPIAELWRIDSSIAGSFSLTLPLLVLFVARALDGLTGGNVSVAQAYLADITDEEERSAQFGRMAVASNLGFVLGPALAGLLGSLPSRSIATGASTGELLPVIAALLISLVALGLIRFRLPESSPCRMSEGPPPSGDVRKLLGQEPRDCFRVGEETVSASWRTILGRPAVFWLLALQFLVYLGFNFFYVAFPVHAAGPLAWRLAQTGAFFSFLGLAMALVQGPVLSRASRHLSDRHLVLVGSFVLASGFAMFTVGTTVAIYVAALFVAIGNGLMWPSLLSLLSKAAPPELQGAIQGYAGSGAALASMVGLLLGGLLYEQISSGVFWLSAGLIGFVFVGATTPLCRERNTESAALR
ncbi:MAG: MFS transporter [Thermoanaerobaculia bacterium]|nr:MFS transporter [Thermoanaerobaculia bacterium]